MRFRFPCVVVSILCLCCSSIAQDNEEPKRLYNVGAAHFSSGKYREAIDCFQQALRIDPLFFEAWIQLGRTHFQLENKEQGIKALEKAVEAAPRQASARLALGTALLEMGNEQAARDTFAQVSPLLATADIPTLFSYAMAAKQVGIDGAVEQSLPFASRIRPAGHREWFILGLLYLEAGNPDRAILAMENATITGSPPPETWYNLGVAHMRAGNHDKAVRTFAQAHKLGMHKNELLMNLGASLSECNRLDDAIIVFREAARRYPDMPEVWYNLGVACARHGWVDEAIRHYERAMALNPEYHEVAIALEDARAFRRLLDEDPAARHSLYQVTP